ncbi:transglycosylase domain-containing protein [Neolewinella litorea]|uniref:Penicillin-binding protein n=1 Tax=Neolewinella litorea TaxID=2562452 RepID=A0A4S4NQ34_9BACT|nr:transglycosylase domain-containing protein [Neolewinella litorea]THH41215.1 penicillin-binding protein [Neolewinella litorea]
MKHLYERVRRWRTERPKTFYSLAALATIAGAMVLGIILLLLLVNGGAFGKMPSRQALLDYRNDIGSEVYDVNGISLGRFYAQDRTVTEFEELPQHLINALVATEDSRFYQHGGIDWEAYGRVVYKTLLQGEDDQGGGSTLSQQLVKNAYGRPRIGYGPRVDLLLHKIREGLLAQRLESVMSKDEVIKRYLNTVSFPGNTFGIAAASQRYFQKEPSELSVRQSASLVASLKGTSSYDPLRAPERNAKRTDLVLRLMHQGGYLTEDQFAAALRDSLGLDYQRKSAEEPLAPHFTQAVKREALQLLADLRRPDGEPYNLFSDNLSIHTTLDMRLQRHAETAVERQMGELQRDFNRHLGRRDAWETEASLRGAIRNSLRWRAGRAAGLDSTAIMAEFNTPRNMELLVPNGEPLTGEFTPLDSVKHSLSYLRSGFLVLDHALGAVRAWVGGSDFEFNRYDHVLSRRQTGSTFKPFVYAAALREGYDPCHRLSNALRTYADEDGPWTPHNSDWNHGGTYSMHGALTHSINVATVKMIMETTPEPVVEIAKEVGLSGEIRPIPSIALGTVESSLFEMTGAYGAFANRGRFSPPYYISRIENADGEVIYEHREPTVTVLNERAGAQMQTMLRYVVERGTASRLRWQYGITRPSIGKTGTTQNMADGWYIGSTPGLTGGAWVGGENTGVRFRSGQMGNGSHSALPIWAYFLRTVQEDSTLVGLLGEEFPEPSADVKRDFYCAEYIPPVEVVEELGDEDDTGEVTPVSELGNESSGG